jgi:hypothetical protein
MGKRELLIVIAFMAMGIVAYELAAPAQPAGSGFSFSRFWQSAARHLRGNRATQSSIQQGVLMLPATATELRVHGPARGVQVVGEDRRDVAWQLAVESNGPDDATALAYARQTTLTHDDLGTALALDIRTPREGTQWAHLVLRVPARLTVRIDGGSAADIAGVAGVRLENVQGTTTISRVAGRVTGTHRSGALTVSDAAVVDLSLVASRAELSGISSSLTLATRAGTCDIRNVRAPIEVDQAGAELTITDPSGPVRVGGTGGRVTIERPRQPVHLDVRRTEIDVTLDAAVPLTLLTTDDPMQLGLIGAPAVAIDAVASDGGHIRTEDPTLRVATIDREQQLTHTFGAADAPRVVLRNLRGDIVIAKRK